MKVTTSVRDGAILGPCYAPENFTLQVRIFRNLFAPVFSSNGSYSIRIREDINVGSDIGVTVSATDADVRVRFFIIFSFAVRKSN